ncbi:hypothetical protein QR680_019132 [Steinernema hermaphroditum]|uniref:Signal recognition particle subunit SRP72 n=1 Tax=Steinernema hermaphroditum TaxID=289476 RepID=A0AA39LS62_9BILA|nr:hypothetical protein QR680_019132 [Steinernema hermaphroditum]
MRRKLVSLIKNGNFKEAESLIGKTSEKVLGDVSFERAYILYRMSRDEEALGALTKTNEAEQRSMELKAQIFYRLGRFEEAYNLLLDVIKNSSDEYEAERTANLLAIAARLESHGQHKDVNAPCSTYEQYYNQSCCLIERQQYAEALDLLEKAEAMSREVLNEDGLNDDEIEEEIAVIIGQKRYLLSVLGQEELEDECLVDVNELEEMMIVPNTSKLRKVGKKNIVDMEIVTGKLRTRKRRRKVILPKNMDPSIKPDSERWLPRQERTAYKRWLKKHKDHDIGRGTQGATSSNGDTVVESSPVQRTSNVPVPEGPRQQRPNAQQTKKGAKKKGKK